MKKVFIQRELLVNLGSKLQSVAISINKPNKDADGLYVTIVQFSNVAKYDAKIRGADEFNAVEGAIRYVEKIVENSVEPEFYYAEGESLLRNK